MDGKSWVELWNYRTTEIQKVTLNRLVKHCISVLTQNLF